MTDCALLRHGAVVGGPCFRGSTDDPLTEEGWTQMWHSVKQQPPWDHIFSSPLQRCANFARELAKRHNTRYTLDARLREIHFGEWEGQTSANIHASSPTALQQFWADPTIYTPPGAEPLLVFQTRVLSCWRMLQHKHQGRRLLLVTHGGVIRTLLCHVSGHPLARMQELEVGHGALLQLPASDAIKPPFYGA